MENRNAISRRQARRKITAKRVYKISLILLAILFFVGGTGVGYIYFKSHTVRKMVHDWHKGMWEPKSAFPGRSDITLLVIGRDADHDRRDRLLKTNARSDTLLLFRLNFNEHTANVLSIPRDTYVDIPGHGMHKINAAHAYGGPELTSQTIESFLGIHPDYYITFDYNSFAKLVDELGGLRVTVDKQLDYDDNWGNLHIHLKPGNQLLNGIQALGFVRYRKSNDGTGDSDLVRITRQQQLLMAAKRKLISPSTFLKLPDIIETVRNGVNSSMTDAQMMASANFIRSISRTSIGMATLPGEPSKGYVIADDKAARELVDKMFH